MEKTELGTVRRKWIVRPSEGRDEFNLAEFPLTLLTDRPPRDTKTLRWEDEIVDSSTGLPIKRQVIVTGSDAFGLPTATDADVLFALVQLTKLKNNFTSKDVFFSRYELLQVLDWRDEGKNYKRLEESLDRWHGTSIYFSAWRDKDSESWRSEKFHVLDNVSLLGRKNRRQLIAKGQREQAVSLFSWNSVIFRNLQRGYVCPVDLDVYFSLKSAISKRMLRYLTKHFRLRQQEKLTFDLKTFAFEKVGLSRSYSDSGQLKKELQPALDELEVIGFLAPMPREDRYTKLAPGSWTITLRRTNKPLPAPPESQLLDEEVEEEPNELLASLVTRGVNPDTARTLVDSVAEVEIRDRVRAFDWLIAKSDERISRNPPGYLIESIRNVWPLPKDFLTWQQSQEKKRKTAERRHRGEQEKTRAEAEDRARAEAEQAQIEAYWERLTPLEQNDLRQNAIAQAQPFLVSQYKRAARDQSEVQNFYLKLIVNSHILKILTAEEA